MQFIGIPARAAMTLGAVELIGTAVFDRAAPASLAEITPPPGAHAPFISSAVRACALGELRAVPMAGELGADEALVRAHAGGDGPADG